MTQMEGSEVFVDTNILLAATDTSRGDHQNARAFLQAGGVHLVTSGQVLREYLVVATRPLDRNGFGMSPEDACLNVRQFLARITFLGEPTDASTLIELVQDNQLRGKVIHDANIVATMRAHGIDDLATLNGKDFAKFSNIRIHAL